MAATMQVAISVQTLIFHLVVNSTHLKTVKSALWHCMLQLNSGTKIAQKRTPTNSREILRGCAF